MNPSHFVYWIWAIWYFYWVYLAIRGGKKTVQRESLASMVRQRVFLLSGYFFVLVPTQIPWLAIPLFEPNIWITWIGVALCLLGFGFSVWARFALGANWSGTVTLKENHQLIQEGPYSWVRHPIYTGLLTATLGTALNTDRVGALLGLGLALLGLHLKMMVEERFMLEQFGQAYTAYARKVKKLIPFVY
jgi:protein-S-isoprenylcysteine O-methyltransferase Ste14